MTGPEPKMVRTVSAMALAIAVTVFLLLPVGYFVIGFADRTAHARTRADITAVLLTDHISTNPKLWMFQAVRINDLIVRHTPGLVNEHVHVRDAQGRLVAAVGSGGRDVHGLMSRNEWAAHEQTAILYDAGQPVGKLSVIWPLAPLLVGTALAAGIGFLLGLVTYMVLRVLPLRALNRALETLSDEKERAEVTLHSIGDAVVTTDAEARVSYLNPVAEQLSGWSSAEAFGKPIEQVLTLVNEVTEEAVPNPLRQALASQSVVPLARETLLVRRDGTRVPIDDNAAPIRAAEGGILGGVLVFHDVSVARRLTSALSWQASHDALTGLVNRAEFERRARRAVEGAVAEGRRHVLCYLDLDQFKLVNDTCGHTAGDNLLMQLAQVLQARLREGDTLARLGGDEFGVLIQDCAIEKGQDIAAGLLAALSDFRFSWKDKVFMVSASIGLVPLTSASQSFVKLLSDADAACYRAKELGRNRVHVGGRDLTDELKHREQMIWVSRINRALESNRFTLYYQPYFALAAKAGEGAYMEILLRMVGENGELVPPGAFIPAAERYNVMTAVDRWVVREVFRNASRIARKFGDEFVCSINLSGQSLGDPRTLEFIRAQSAEHGISPTRFCFEITETAAVNEMSRAVSLINELKAMGFKFALDDFGTGMSSFGYLKNLPVDLLKIDGAFVREIARDEVSRSMVTAMVQIGHSMGLGTVAEFVDSEAVLGVLRDIGASYAQGYHVGKPAPLFAAEEVEAATAPATLA